MIQLYIASQDRGGGILRCGLSGEGELSILEKYPLDRPAYMCFGEGRLYVLLREPFMLQSGIMSYEILPDGSLSAPTEPQPVHGTVASHIYFGRGRLYCSNYLSGSTILMPDKLLAHNGSGPVPQRQSCSHPHCICPGCGGERLFITDLGADKIYVCSEELELLDTVSAPAGSGPRHLIFSGDGDWAYCSDELSSTVSLYACRDKSLSYICSVPSVPPECKGENSASAIRLSADGKQLYVSNRGCGGVSVFSLKNTVPELTGFYSMPGASVRDFNIAGDYLICGDENNHSVSVFSLKAGPGSREVCRISAVRPWCILPEV